MPDNDFIDNLKRQAEENPLVAMGVTAALITAIGKLINANSNSRNSRAWAQEVERRVKQSSKK